MATRRMQAGLSREVLSADGRRSNLHPTGRVDELMQLAEEHGSVTPQEIADVLDVDELPINASLRWSVGEK